MKKFLASILAVLYFATTAGATVHLHYCMGKMVEQNLWHEQKKTCSKCGMENSQQDNGCCKDEHKQVKVENDHYASAVVFHSMQLASAALPVTFLEIPDIAFSSITEENPTGHAPPRSSGIALYKRICVFRI